MKSAKAVPKFDTITKPTNYHNINTFSIYCTPLQYGSYEVDKYIWSTEWLNQDFNDSGYQHLSYTKIVEQVTTTPEGMVDDSSQQVSTCEEVTKLIDKYQSQDK